MRKGLLLLIIGIGLLFVIILGTFLWNKSVSDDQQPPKIISSLINKVLILSQEPKSRLLILEPGNQQIINKVTNVGIYSVGMALINEVYIANSGNDQAPAPFFFKTNYSVSFSRKGTLFNLKLSTSPTGIFSLDEDVYLIFSDYEPVYRLENNNNSASLKKLHFNFSQLIGYYLANSSEVLVFAKEKDLAFLDGKTNKVIKKVSLTKKPTAFEKITDNKGYLFFDKGSVQTVDLTELKLDQKINGSSDWQYVLKSRNGLYVYAENTHPSLVFLNPADNIKVKRIKIKQTPTRIISVNSAKDYLVYFDNTNLENKLDVIDVNKKEIVKTLKLGREPVDMIKVKDKVYVANSLDKTLTIIDTKSDSIENTIMLPAKPVDLAAQGNNIEESRNIIINL